MSRGIRIWKNMYRYHLTLLTQWLCRIASFWSIPDLDVQDLWMSRYLLIFIQPKSATSPIGGDLHEECTSNRVLTH